MQSDNISFSDTPSRARHCVALAASLVSEECGELKSWLEMDERGTWERSAAELLAQVPELMRQGNLDLPDAEVDRQVALMLKLRALNAAIASARKRA